MQHLNETFRAFISDDNGAQVIEYALVVALIAMTVALALGTAVAGVPQSFADLARHVADCLTPGSAAC